MPRLGGPWPASEGGDLKCSSRSVHDDDVLGTAARRMFRQSEGRQRPLLEGAVIGDGELSLRALLSEDGSSSASTRRTDSWRPSTCPVGQREHLCCLSNEVGRFRGWGLIIRRCASCRWPRSQGVEGWAGGRCLFLEASATPNPA